MMTSSAVIYVDKSITRKGNFFSYIGKNAYQAYFIHN